MFFETIEGPFRLLLSSTGWLSFVLILGSCGPSQDKNDAGENLYPASTELLSPQELVNAYCGACHLPPDPNNIPKTVWQKKVLPEMAARLGFIYDDYNPYAQYSMEENVYVRLSRIYPQKPALDSATWQSIHDYIISQAPDTIPTDMNRAERNKELVLFDAKPIILDNNMPRITSITFDEDSAQFVVGNAYGQLGRWSPKKDFASYQFSSPPIAYSRQGIQETITEIGFMNPSEKPLGSIHSFDKGAREDTLITKLHRPVFTEITDLDNDGIDEILVCEFGHLTGELSMLVKDEKGYTKQTVLPVPGTIKVSVRDMDGDGLKDIVVLASQGNEGLYILYQKEGLRFDVDHVIRLGSEYGSSWFDLMDYDDDGDLDVVLVNGDNADYTIFLKPYHGVRLYLNNGENSFEQAWFYPIYGATRVIARDFDLDQDIDFAVMSFFAGPGDLAEESFVFLQNEAPASFQFTPFTFEESVSGRWLIMEAGDYDRDGDQDIMLGSFMFGPPRNQPQFTGWPEELVDVILLENKTVLR